MSDANLSTVQARALAAPTRRSIVDVLVEADRDVTVAELAAHLGLNHNGVRKHLAQLVAAGLVTEHRESRSAPGRPRLLYRLAPGSTADVDAPYRRLAVLLATALARDEDPAVVGRDAVGPRQPASGPPVEQLAARLAAEGFEPMVRRRGQRADLVLQRCPFAAAVDANPAVVCRMHLGMAEGAAAALGGLSVEGLAAKDPHRAGCILTVREDLTA